MGAVAAPSAFGLGLELHGACRHNRTSNVEDGSIAVTKLNLYSVACIAGLLSVCGAQTAVAAPQQGLGGGQPGGAAAAQQTPSAPTGTDERPYDAQLARLAELLGSIHYLRELCGANDGQTWRNQMKELVGSEGTTALRRAHLVEAFNKGYRSYARTYRSCTPPAVTAIGHFMDQGATLAETLAEQHK